MNRQLVVCAVASNDYLIFLERLLASVQVNLPGVLFHAVLVNVDKLKVPYLKSLYKNLEIDHDFVQFDSIDQQFGFCANRRARLILELMLKHNYPIVAIDVDSLFINPADELINYAKKYDLSVQYSPDHRALKASSKEFQRLPKGPLGTPYYGVFSAGVMTTNNSSIAKDFFREYKRQVERNLLGFYSDQEGLYLAYKCFKDRLNFSPLDFKFWSRKNRSDCIIWTAKGSTKDSDEFRIKGDNYIFKVKKWQENCILTVEQKEMLKKYKLRKKDVTRTKKILRKIMNFSKHLIYNRLKEFIKENDENRRYINKYILEFAHSLSNSSKVLDIGSRKLRYINYLRKIFGHCQLITSDLTPGGGIDQVIDATKMPFEDNFLDGIICTEVLEHVFNYEEIVKECYRVLKKNGKMIVTVPFYFNIHSKPDMPDYFRFTDQALQKIFCQFKEVKIVPFGKNLKRPLGYAVHVSGK